MAGNQPHPGSDFRGAHGVAIGNNNTVNSNNYQRGGPAETDEVTRLLGELDRRITEYQDRIADVEDLRAAVEALKEQVSSGRPSRGVVKTLLLGMTSTASGVTAVAGAIERVRAVLGV